MKSLPTKRRPETEPDWVGLWFKFQEEIGGEFVGIRYGVRARQGGDLQWTFLPHTEFDGIGGFAHLLRKRGAAPAARNLGLLREPRPPSLGSRLWAALRFVTKKAPRAASWRTFDANWRSASVGPKLGSPTAVAAERLSAERTRLLGERARELGVSVNTFLLWALNRAIAPELGPKRSAWLLPVNMRGAVRAIRDTANQVAYIQLESSAEASPTELHDSIRLALQKRQHWGAWMLLSCGKLLGRRAVRRIYLHDCAGGRAWMGAFSNIGSWHGLPDDAHEWFFCPPVAQVSPFAAGVVTCDGCLSLTLQAHPSIARDPSWARAVLDRWLGELG